MSTADPGPRTRDEPDGGGPPGRTDYEHYRGCGIMALPFDSGHALALRVMPENDVAPFRAVWHRTPAGEWSVYVDGPHPELFGPWLYGPAPAASGRAPIHVDWSGGRVLRVRMEEPALDWTVRLRSSPFTRLVNRALPRLPLELYRRRPALALVRQLADRALGSGPVDLEGAVPGGQRVLVRPRRLYLVGDARAVLRGEDLGSPTRASENPTAGSFRWPARGVLAEGDVYVEVDDPVEHRRRRALIRTEATLSAAS